MFGVAELAARFAVAALVSSSELAAAVAALVAVAVGLAVVATAPPVVEHAAPLLHAVVDREGEHAASLLADVDEQHAEMPRRRVVHENLSPMTEEQTRQKLFQIHF